MKLVKKNKFTIIAVVLFIIFMLGVSEIKKVFFSNNGAVYGDRLVGKVEVSKDTYTQLESKLKENERVESVSVRENGRLINISVTVLNDTSLEDAKSVTDGIVDLFTDNQKGYYDFQIFISKTDPSENNFPIIGYRHHNNSEFVWSKDRDKTDISS